MHTRAHTDVRVHLPLLSRFAQVTVCLPFCPRGHTFSGAGKLHQATYCKKAFPTSPGSAQHHQSHERVARGEELHLFFLPTRNCRTAGGGGAGRMWPKRGWGFLTFIPHPVSTPAPPTMKAFWDSFNRLYCSKRTLDRPCGCCSAQPHCQPGLLHLFTYNFVHGGLLCKCLCLLWVSVSLCVFLCLCLCLSL